MRHRHGLPNTSRLGVLGKRLHGHGYGHCAVSGGRRGAPGVLLVLVLLLLILLLMLLGRIGVVHACSTSSRTLLRLLL